MATRVFGVSKQASVLYSMGYPSANDKHHPVGKNGSYYTRAYMQFTLDYSDMVRITSAVLRLKTTGQTHLAFGSGPTVSIWRNNNAWSASGGSENSWVASGEPTPAPAAKGSDVGPFSFANTENTVRDFNILGLVRAWAPTSVDVPGIGVGLGESNYGIQIRAGNEGSASDSIEFYSSLGGYAPSIIVTYESGVAPLSPTLGAPSGRISGTTPTFSATARDTSPNFLTSYDMQVATDINFTAPTWDIVSGTSGISGQAYSRAYGGSALTRGKTYYWRSRTTNDAGLKGPWSTAKTFYPNSLPTAKATSPSGTISAVASGATDPGDPAFVFVGTEVDSGDSIASYDLQVDTSSGFGSPIVDIVASSTGLSGSTVTRTPAVAYVRGTTYYWRARFKDATGEYGPYCTTQSFKFRALIAATPTAGALAAIGNLTDKAIWTSGGNHAKPTLPWTISDPDGGGQTKYRVRIYSASSGGTTLLDTGTVTSAALSLLSSYAVINGTNYWYTVQPSNKYETGLETARTQFHVRWAQAIYAQNVTTAATDVGFKSASTPSGTQTAFIFRGASTAGGATPTAWYTSAGSVPASAYMQVLARLATTTVGTSARIPDMTLTYTLSNTDPDGLFRSGASVTTARDGGVLFAGSPSLRVRNQAVGGTGWVAFRFPSTPTSYIPVIAGQVYTASVWIRTDGPIAGGPVKVLVASQDDGTTIRSGLGVVNGQTTDSPLWQRLWITLTVPDGTTGIRMYIHQGAASGTDDTYWIAAPRFELGNVAGPPVPNLSSDLATWDGIGGQVDASQGGIFRLRGSDGAARSIVELGVKGLKFGGPTSPVELSSDVAGILHAGGLPIVTGTTKKSSFTTMGLWYWVGTYTVPSSGVIVPYIGREATPTTLSDNRPNFPTPTGRVVGIACRASAAPTAGSVTLSASRAGATVGTGIVYGVGASVYQQQFFTPVEFTAGQSIGVNMDIASSTTPTNLTFGVWLICEIDVP